MKDWELKEFDVLSIQRKASLMTAEILKIEEPELLDNLELASLIKARDENIYKALFNFSNSYWNLLFYCKGISSHGRVNELSSMDKERLEKHIIEKNEAKRFFLNEIKKISLAVKG
jgi:superoxide dismutase